MTERRLKIAYLCDMDPSLTWSYSGGNARIFKALQDHVGDVEFIDNGWGRFEWVRRAIHKMPEAINIRLRWRMHYALSKQIARYVNAQLRDGDFDVALGVYSLHSLSHIKTPEHMPMVFTSDATQTSYRQSEVGAGFKSHMRLGRLLDRWIEGHERAVLTSTDKNFWPSDWQKDLADRTYGLNEEASVVLPWGANVDAPAIEKISTDLGFEDGLRLLLVGRSWHAKGGDVTFATVQALRDRGIDASLSVIGCTPPEYAQTDFVQFFHNLDKTIPEDLATFESIFRNAHALMQPSLESYGFAFCEASAFAVPSLCVRQGGIPVWNGINGEALEIGATPQDFADQLMDWMQNPADYKKMRLSSRQCFEDKLNWAAWGAALKAQLQDLVDNTAEKSR